jgi:hypothetical protein
MAFGNGPRIVTNGLIVSLDAADRNSYPGSGTTWTDLSGNSNNGTLVNSPTFSSTNGGTIVFNGTNQYVTDTINIASSAFTIICWVYPNVTPNSNTFFSVGTAPQNRQAIHLRMVSNTSFLFGMYNDDLSATVIGVTGVWNCFAVTLTTGFVQSIYMNGIFNTSRTAGGYYVGNTTCNIGRWANNNGEYVNGNISIVQVYNRALSATEIQQNYNATKSRFNLT